MTIHPKKQAALRKSAGVKKGAPIPTDKLKGLAQSKSKPTAKKAKFALNMRKVAKKGK